MKLNDQMRNDIVNHLAGSIYQKPIDKLMSVVRSAARKMAWKRVPSEIVAMLERDPKLKSWLGGTFTLVLREKSDGYNVTTVRIDFSDEFIPGKYMHLNPDDQTPKQKELVDLHVTRQKFINGVRSTLNKCVTTGDVLKYLPNAKVSVDAVEAAWTAARKARTVDIKPAPSLTIEELNSQIPKPAAKPAKKETK